VPQPPEGELLIIPAGIITFAEEPVVNTSVLMDKRSYGEDLIDSKYSPYKDVLTVLIVILAHLVLLWCLWHTPYKVHSASAQQGKKGVSGVVNACLSC